MQLGWLAGWAGLGPGWLAWPALWAGLLGWLGGLVLGLIAEGWAGAAWGQNWVLFGVFQGVVLALGAAALVQNLVLFSVFEGAGLGLGWGAALAALVQN